jgi:hypothetical protein
LERLNDEIEKKRPHLKKKKVLFHQDNAPCHKSIKMNPQCILQIWPPVIFFVFADLKRMLAGKKFSTNEEVIAETEAYFEAKEKSYYKNGIEKLYDRYNRCIALEGMNNKIEFYQKNVFNYVSLRNFKPNCYLAVDLKNMLKKYNYLLNFVPIFR